MGECDCSDFFGMRFKLHEYRHSLHFLPGTSIHRGSGFREEHSVLSQRHPLGRFFNLLINELGSVADAAGRPSGRRSPEMEGASSVVEQRAQPKAEAEAVKESTAATRWSERHQEWRG